MENIFELIFEVIFGFVSEWIFESRVPKYVRYLLLTILVLFFLFVIGFFIYESIS